MTHSKDTTKDSDANEPVSPEQAAQAAAALQGFDYQKYMESVSTVLGQQKALVDAYASAAKEQGQSTSANLEDITTQMAALLKNQQDTQQEETDDETESTESSPSDTYVLSLKEGLPLSIEKQWAIAASADLSARNGSYLNSLDNGMLPGVAKNLLDTWWGVTDRTSAIQTITDLLQKGQRVKFESVRSILEAMLAEESTESLHGRYRNELIQKWTDSYVLIEQSQVNKLSIVDAMVATLATKGDAERGLSQGPYEDYIALVQEHIDTLEDASSMQDYIDLFTKMKRLKEDGLLTGNKLPSLLAWDYCRAINVARGCFDAKFLTEGEVWEFICKAASALQGEYHSWKELSIAYSAGYLYWSDDFEAEYITMKFNREHLLADPKSPWVTLAWDTPLKP